MDKLGGKSRRRPVTGRVRPKVQFRVQIMGVSLSMNICVYMRGLMEEAWLKDLQGDAYRIH